MLPLAGLAGGLGGGGGGMGPIGGAGPATSGDITTPVKLELDSATGAGHRGAAINIAFPGANVSSSDDINPPVTAGIEGYLLPIGLAFVGVMALFILVKKGA